MTKAKKPTIADLTAALQQERADAENLRRRHEEQIAGLKTMVKANLIHDLLPVIDNFERSLKHVPKDLANNEYIKGIDSIVKQFEKTIEQMGVESIKTVGEIFDPRLHEAVSMDDGDGEVELVSEELTPGYKIGDDIIRHAMVKVKMGRAK